MPLTNGFQSDIPIDSSPSGGGVTYTGGLGNDIARTGSAIGGVFDALGSSSYKSAQADLEGARLDYQMAKDKYNVDQQQEQRATKSDTAMTVFNVMKQYNNIGYGSSGIPQSVTNSVNQEGQQLATVQAAESQGKVPLGSLDIQLENSIASLMAQHPEYGDEIMGQLKDMGYDHFLFRNIKARDTSVAALQKTADDTQDLYYSTGLKLGATGTPEQIMQVGADHVRAQMNLETIQNIKATDDASKAVKDQQTTSAVLGVISSVAGTATDRYIAQLSQAAQGGDATWGEAIKNAGPQVNLTIQSVRANVLNYMAQHGITNTKPVEDYLDNLQKSLTESISGKASDFAQRVRDVQDLQNKLTINSAKAYPLATQLKAAFGSGWMQTLNPVYTNPDLVKQLQNEMNGVVPGQQLIGTSQGRQVINTIASAVNGQLGPISQIPPDQVPTVMKGLAGAYNYSTNALVSKSDTSMQTQNTWRNSYGKLLEALSSVTANPNDQNININSLSTAANMLYTGSTRAVLEDHLKQQGESRELGEALLLHSRTTAVGALEALRARDYGQYQLAFNPRSGQYFVSDKTGNPAQAPKGNQLISGLGMGGPITTAYGGNGSTVGADTSAYLTAQQAAQTGNRLLDHMVLTDKYDQQLPQGATPLSQRKFWASGGNTDNLIDAKGNKLINQQTPQGQPANPVKAIGDWSNSLSDLIPQMNRVVNTSAEAAVDYPAGQQYYGAYVKRAETREGLPPGLLSRVIEQESSWDPSAKAPGSTASGIAQFVQGTAKQFGLDPSDPYSSIDKAAQYLAQLKAKTGSWAKAVDAYGTTAVSNFKTQDQANKIRSRILNGVQ